MGLFDRFSKKSKIKASSNSNGTELQKSILRLSEVKGQLFITDIEAEVINFTCVQLFKDRKTEIFDFMEYTNKNCQIVENLFPEYDASHTAAAQMSVMQNMEWSGMKNFLKDYYLKNHKVSIDI